MGRGDETTFYSFSSELFPSTGFAVTSKLSFVALAYASQGYLGQVDILRRLDRYRCSRLAWVGIWSDFGLGVELGFYSQYSSFFFQIFAIVEISNMTQKALRSSILQLSSLSTF